MVGNPMSSIPHEICMWFITLHSQVYSHAPSYKAMILELLVDTPTIVYL
jgi:hypothetical protein